jgi:hypothetical protein
LWRGSYYCAAPETKGKYSRTADAVIKLQTGGKGLPGMSVPQAVFKFTGSASEVLDKYTATPTAEGTKTKPIAKTSITINGKALADDGIMYQKLSDNITRDVTPRVKNKDYYTFYVDASRHTLVHQTICTAKGNTNSARRTIGIGEEVAVYLDPPVGMTFPETPFWYVLGDGTINLNTGSSTMLTANLSPGSATVKVNVRDVTLSTSFGIVAPSGIGNVSVYRDLGLGEAATNLNDAKGIGAKTEYWFDVLPTNVSFAHVSFRENLPTTPTFTWPCGTNTYLNSDFWYFGGNGACAYATSDTIQGGIFPIKWLFDGTNFTNFAYTTTWTNEYLNSYSNYVPFATMQATYHFYGTTKQSQTVYQGVTGGLQGPWVNPGPFD